MLANGGDEEGKVWGGGKERKEPRHGGLVEGGGDPLYSSPRGGMAGILEEWRGVSTRPYGLFKPEGNGASQPWKLTQA